MTLRLQTSERYKAGGGKVYLVVSRIGALSHFPFVGSRETMCGRAYLVRTEDGDRQECAMAVRFVALGVLLVSTAVVWQT